jgi:TrmH family RNA methyltransferase
LRSHGAAGASVGLQPLLFQYRIVPSPSNVSQPVAKRVRALIRGKSYRDQQRCFIVDTAKLILELLKHKGNHLETLLVTPDFLTKHRDILLSPRIVPLFRLYQCSRETLDRLSDTQTAQDALAIVRQPIWNGSELSRQASLLAVYLDSVQDPTNVGTLIRTAAGFGLDAVWLSPGCADVFSPKVVRASAGTILAIPTFRDVDLSSLASFRLVWFAADSSPEGATPVSAITRRPTKTMLAFGNESQGLSEQLRRTADVRFCIPLEQGVESLNVASAAAIGIHHFSTLPFADILPDR